MNPLVTYSVLCFGSLFSIVDPFAAVPIFLVLVGQQPKPAQNRIALRATLTCFAVLTAFAAAGSFIFTFFGITIPAFKVAGGILLFGVALDMMRAKPSPTRTTQEERTEAESKEDVGLIPMGIPLLSGPGAIAATMVLAGKAHGIQFILDGAREALPALVHDVPAPSAQKATAPDFRPGPLAFSSR
jgi:multiple antibiotic resistance protein